METVVVGAERMKKRNSKKMEQRVVELIVDLATIVIVNGMRKHKAVAVGELVHVMKNYESEDVVEEDVDAEMVMVL